MRRAAEIEKCSHKEQMEPSSKKHGFTGKKKVSETPSRGRQRTRCLNLSLMLLIATIITPLTDSRSNFGHLSIHAFAESGDVDSVGTLDKRPVRRAPDGTEIVDYISELEQSNDVLEQQIRSLKEQLARQNSGSLEASGDTSLNPIKERDLLGGSHKEPQETSQSPKRYGANGHTVEAKVIEQREDNNSEEKSIEHLRDTSFSQSSADIGSLNLREGNQYLAGDHQKIRRGLEEDAQRIGVQPEARSIKSEIEPQLDQPRYIAPVLPIGADEEPKNLVEDQPAIPQSVARPIEADLVDSVGLEKQAEKPMSGTDLPEQQIRARLLPENDTDNYSGQSQHLETEHKQQPIKESEEILPFDGQEQEGQALVANEHHRPHHESNEYIAHSTKGLSQRSINDDSTIIDAKRRVRTDVSTLISLVATREQLFRRYGSQGGQIQVSPSRLVTQRGQTVESVRARQEEAVTIRDWKLIEADIAELRKIAEKDISFIRRYSRRNSG